ncbi:hypothetical protein G7050_09045 [Dysgonomonas sp. HDW5A]|uniref:Ig-like domain-containing protein n=1 Tax=Dysgonomonas sp. HDW5A TaxID=2714926 RepID=UPI00140884DC|nr:Ig-like domain-containing protein [Dysgonomonas sp. HDW5A]QIK59968.1 hypothetical protein G7050_09045 [Dysgonomonas sp. HDW5A]
MIRNFILLGSGIIVLSCASMGSPSGGDYDFDPPKVLSSRPTPNETFVKSGKVQIVFDELVQIEKPMEKVIVTPPQRNFPIIRAQNNKVIVELKDTLIANTTYTIDFTDAIVDNNEKNALEDFALSFSTGAVVDTLSISGKVLAADNLEPVSGIYVGIHSNLSDTAFTTLPFKRISRTNELGRYSIKGIAPGEYKIYALDDVNRDYKYDNPGEAIAFLDKIIVPSVEAAVRQDSVFNLKDLSFDTIKTVHYTKFLPDDIVLRSFTSDFKRQYLQKHERLTEDVISIYFGAPTAMPKIEALDIPKPITDWSVLERTAGNDTLKFWITEKAIAAMDTLSLRVSYNMTDSLNKLQPVTDTLNFISRTKKKVKDDKKKDKDEEVTFLTLTTDIAQLFDVYKDINIEFDYPVKDFEKNKIFVQYQADSTYSNVDYVLEKDSLNPRKYRIQNKWIPGGQYRFVVDSATLHSYTGLWNDKQEVLFKVKTLDQYGSLDINIYNLPDSMPAFVELLDKSDKPVYRATVKDDIASFVYLNPGIYYARIILDANGNGRWDPGDYSEMREPEMVNYYPKTFEIRAFWDITEDWDLGTLPLDKQKPLDITKNKPKDDEKRKKMMERRDAQNAKKDSQRNSNTTNGMNNNNNNNQYPNNQNTGNRY